MRSLLCGLALVLAGAGAVAAQSIPSQPFRDCPECPELVVIPPGAIRMGSSDSDRNEERPVREVRIAKPFALSRTEISFDEWEVCVRASRCPLPDDHRWGRGKQPVIKVTWNDAIGYARFLSDTTGKRYRLPSEAEWEYAARAGTATPYWWGAEVGTNRANCRNCGAPFQHRAAPVASFPPNPFGLFDMNGNLAEWTLDCWFDSHADAPTDGRARETPGCDRRTIRGGSWYYIAKVVTSAYRTSFPAAHSSYQIGVRVLRELP